MKYYLPVHIYVMNNSIAFMGHSDIDADGGHDRIPEDRGKCKMVWYGERGVVNSLFYCITEHDLMRELLLKIKWAGGTDDLWTDCITKTAIIIEVGLNDFGNPDVILVVEDCREKLQFVFIEAKVSSYVESAMISNSGMVKGYNSSINGQLALKYRFVQALKTKDSKSHIIRETKEMYNAYKEVLFDPRGYPRTLKRSTVIEKILKPNQFNKACLSNSYFIAMTVEEDGYNPFTDTENNDILPVILDEKSENVWDKVKGHFGSLNLEEVKNMILCPDFHAVYELMTEKVEKQEKRKCPSLEIVALSQFSEETLVCCQQYADKKAEESEGWNNIRLKGSYSILDENGFVVGKIVPRKNEKEIWYGVRVSMAGDPLLPETRGKWCINGVPFIFYKIDSITK